MEQKEEVKGREEEDCAIILGSKYWVRDPTDGWKLAVARISSADSYSFNILEETNKTVTIPVGKLKKQIHIAGSQLDHTIDDLVNLNELSEGDILHHVKRRFCLGQIYTNVGPVLIAVNPLRKLCIYGQDEISSRRTALNREPHVYSTAANALLGLRDQARQSILISGESGAGKTETTKHVLIFLSENDKHSFSDGPGIAGLMERSNILLESIGNAKTQRNDNSSRFGKWMDVYYDNRYRIRGSQIKQYLLEKSRVNYHASEERTFHLFYQLIRGAREELRQKLSLTNNIQDYEYTSHHGATFMNNHEDDALKFAEFEDALQLLNLTAAEHIQFFQILAAILHLGNLKFQKVSPRGFDSGCFVEPDPTNIEVLNLCYRLLGLPDSEGKLEEFKNSLIRDVNPAGASIKDKELNWKEAGNFRDALARSLYGYLFDWIIVKINDGMRSSEDVHASIGILDLFGFEVFEQNFFEQLCINFANEKLQLFFHEVMVGKELQIYKDDGVNDERLSFVDNEITVRVSDMVLRSLDDFCKFRPRLNEKEEKTKRYLTDEQFLNSIKKSLEQKEVLSCDVGSFTFDIVHFAGPVRYNVHEFTVKNRDTMTTRMINILRNDSELGIIQLGINSQYPIPSAASGNEGKKKNTLPTLASNFKNSLNELLDTLRHTEAHFIKCVKPNEMNDPDAFHGALVMKQLLNSGLVTVTNVRKNGYTYRETFEKFEMKFMVLFQELNQIKERRERCECLISQILEMELPSEIPPRERRVDPFTTALANPDNIYQFGKTKVFLKTTAVLHRLTFLKSVVFLQYHVRKFLVKISIVGRRLRIWYLLRDLNSKDIPTCRLALKSFESHLVLNSDKALAVHERFIANSAAKMIELLEVLEKDQKQSSYVGVEREGIGHSEPYMLYKALMNTNWSCLVGLDFDRLVWSCLVGLDSDRFVWFGHLLRPWPDKDESKYDVIATIQRERMKKWFNSIQSMSQYWIGQRRKKMLLIVHRIKDVNRKRRLAAVSIQKTYRRFLAIKRVELWRFGLLLCARKVEAAGRSLKTIIELNVIDPVELQCSMRLLEIWELQRMDAALPPLKPLKLDYKYIEVGVKRMYSLHIQRVGRGFLCRRRVKKIHAKAIIIQKYCARWFVRCTTGDLFRQLLELQRLLETISAGVVTTESISECEDLLGIIDNHPFACKFARLLHFRHQISNFRGENLIQQLHATIISNSIEQMNELLLQIIDYHEELTDHPVVAEGLHRVKIQSLNILPVLTNVDITTVNELMNALLTAGMVSSSMANTLYTVLNDTTYSSTIPISQIGLIERLLEEIEEERIRQMTLVIDKKRLLDELMDQEDEDTETIDKLMNERARITRELQNLEDRNKARSSRAAGLLEQGRKIDIIIIQFKECKYLLTNVLAIPEVSSRITLRDRSSLLPVLQTFSIYDIFEGYSEVVANRPKMNRFKNIILDELRQVKLLLETSPFLLTVAAIDESIKSVSNACDYLSVLHSHEIPYFRSEVYACDEAFQTFRGHLHNENMTAFSDSLYANRFREACDMIDTVEHLNAHCSEHFKGQDPITADLLALMRNCLNDPTVHDSVGMKLNELDGIRSPLNTEKRESLSNWHDKLSHLQAIFKSCLLSDIKTRIEGGIHRVNALLNERNDDFDPGPMSKSVVELQDFLNGVNDYEMIDALLRLHTVERVTLVNWQRKLRRILGKMGTFESCQQKDVFTRIEEGINRLDTFLIEEGLGPYRLGLGPAFFFKPEKELKEFLNADVTNCEMLLDLRAPQNEWTRDNLERVVAHVNMEVNVIDIPELTSKQKLAIRLYTLGYPKIYAALNEGYKSKYRQREMLRSCSGPLSVLLIQSIRALSGVPGYSYEGDAYRGVSISGETPFEKELKRQYDDYMNEYKVEKLFTFFPFTSVSTSRHIAEEFMDGVGMLYVFKNIRGVKFSSLSAHGHENEVLMEPPTVFKLTSISKGTDEILILTFENTDCDIRYMS